MLAWYFEQTKEMAQLEIAPNTRTTYFQRMQGCKETGLHETKDIKFELSFEESENL